MPVLAFLFIMIMCEKFIWILWVVRVGFFHDYMVFLQIQFCFVLFFFGDFTHSPDGHLGVFLVWGIYKYEHLSSLLFFNVLTLEDR